MSVKICKTIKKFKALKLELFEDKKKVGRVYLYIINNDLHKQSYGYIEDLLINKKFRGKGYGTILLNKAVSEAKKMGLYKLVSTSRTGRAQVHKFYQKNGFKKYGWEFRMDL
jgi:GNAT superfamily N-acetyltransferase